MTHTEIVLTCIGFGVLVLACCIVMAIGLCKMAGRDVPHPDEPKYCYKAKCEKEDE
jgi:hypothetical protein